MGRFQVYLESAKKKKKESAKTSFRLNQLTELGNATGVYITG
jgi:hypothetical protein